MRKYTFLLLVFFFSSTYAQQALLGFEPWESVAVLENGTALKHPWAGGMNNIIVNSLDLNFDGVEDLVLFDRIGSRVMPFIVIDNGSKSYKFAPQYADKFPFVESWMLLRDYNCDGLKDIFYNKAGNFYVHKNVSSGGVLAFVPENNGEYLESQYSGGKANLYSSKINLPGIADVDGDGDIDILAYGTNGARLYLHENQSSCGLNFKVTQDCYGLFQESSLFRSLELNQCTNGKAEKTMHEGSSLTPFDINGDGLMDLFAGNVNFPNITAAFNGGTVDTAVITSQDTLYPNYNKMVDVWNFPAAFVEDGNFDGKPDVFFSPYETNLGSTDNHSLWFYENTKSGAGITSSFVTDEFLQGEMIELGSDAFPRLVDLTGDGLLDLVVSNNRYQIDEFSHKPMIYYYKNTGTTTHPKFTLIDTNFLGFTDLNLANAGVPAFGDLDGDGDKDIILGLSTGYIHYMENSGDFSNPIFNGITQPLLNNSYRPAGYSTPFLYDLDDDGDLDLLVGYENGKVSYLENSSATNFNFTEVTSSYGGIRTTDGFDQGYAVPYAFEYNGKPVLAVGSESRGVFIFDSIQSTTASGTLLAGVVDTGNTSSSNADETPFGTTKFSGRNQFLFTSAELQSFGFVYGSIPSISFEIEGSTSTQIGQGITIKMKNTPTSELNDFENDGMVTVAQDLNIGTLTNGWNSINLQEPFIYDGQSSLIIEICFKNNLPISNNIKVSMHKTAFKSNAFGDVTNYNMAGKDGCSMPFKNSVNLRPNMQIQLIPTFVKNHEFYNIGARAAPAIGDLNGDGFPDMLIGNSSGGLRLFKGKEYDPSVGIKDEDNEPLSIFEMYPNPASGRVTIARSQNKAAEVQVYDLSGNLILMQQLTNTVSELNLEGRAKGLYLIMLQEGETIETKKLILQ